jgi:hypothetical protein
MLPVMLFDGVEERCSEGGGVIFYPRPKTRNGEGGGGGRGKKKRYIIRAKKKTNMSPPAKDPSIRSPN